jgi:hypothetical protein
MSTQTSKPLCGQDFELTDLMRPTVTACFGDALPIYTEPGTRSRLATQLIHTRPTAWCQVPTIPEKTIFEFKELFS